MNAIETTLLSLVRVGMGNACNIQLSSDLNWMEVVNLSLEQGVCGIALDGLTKLKEYYGDRLSCFPDIDSFMEWVGQAHFLELQYQKQLQAVSSLADIFHKAGLKIIVLKGFSLSQLYSAPCHRPCCDFDCFLLYSNDKSRHDILSAQNFGDEIVKDYGVDVNAKYYVHSKFTYKDVVVENHKHLMPIKGSKKDKLYEQKLLSLISGSEPSYINDTWMETPTPMFQSLFVLSHAKGHFVNEKISLRHICDWAVIINTYRKDIDWNEWKNICEEYDLLKFGYTLSRLAQKVCGIELPFECDIDQTKEKALLMDILQPEHKIDGHSRFIRHFQILKNIYQSSWKFNMFSTSSRFFFIAKRIFGFLFDNDVD